MDTPLEPQNTPQEPLESKTAQIGELQEPQNTPKFDNELVNEIVEKVNKKLERKLYYGRKQEKANEIQDKKIKNQDTESQKGNIGFYILSGFLIIVSSIMCYFGFKHLKEQKENENKR